MIFKKIRVTVLLILLVTLAFLSISCAAPNQRVNEGLDKAKAYGAVEIKGTGNATVSLETAGSQTKVDYSYDIKSKDKDVSMNMDIKSDVINMTMDVYKVGDQLLINMPLLTDKYIDASEMKDKMDMEGIQKILTSFDFDAQATKLETEDETINFEGADTKFLKVKVILNTDQMKEIIKKVYQQQNFTSDALSGSDVDSSSLFDNIDLKSADYTIYLDKDNNIKRYEIKANYTMTVNGEVASTDMVMDYDVVNTDDTVEIKLPDIDQQNIISMSDLIASSK